jgi:cysteine desulfurase
LTWFEENWRTLGLSDFNAPATLTIASPTFTSEGAAAGALVTELDKRGFYVASGSACTADSRMPSHVLEAMGLPRESSIRISLPPTCTPDDIREFLQALPDALETVVAD